VQEEVLVVVFEETKKEKEVLVFVVKIMLFTVRIVLF
jgi:hypothetical protein